MHKYKTYGLVIASELVLPELIVWESADSPDVYITTRPLVETLENASFTDNISFSDMSFQVAQDCCQINAEGVARYRIIRGQHIWVDAEPGVPPNDVRLFLLGSVLGALLHQRRCLPLHVSSVVTSNGVWAFTGDSGAGKSTLAAALHYKFDWPLLSDDVGVILSGTSEQAMLYAGPPRLKLWQDTLDFLTIDQGKLIQDRTRVNKFHLKLENAFQQDPYPLQAIVSLERASPGELLSLTQIEGVQAFQAIARAVYRPNSAAHLNDAKALFTLQSLLAKKVRVYRYRRPWSLSNFESSLQPLTDKIRALAMTP